MEQLRLSIIIPCYNEEAGIPNLAAQLDPILEELGRLYEVELIFVDDGSTDNTNELLQQHYGQKKNAIILKHDKNKNLGAALKTGFAQAKGDFVAALDSDCTYSPQLLLQMLQEMDEKTDVITVSPYHPKGKVNNVPAYRIFLSKSVSRIYRILLHSHLYTYTAMVRIYRKEVVKNVRFESNTFLGVTELLTRSILQGYNTKEIPAELHVRKFGQSKMKTLSVIGDHLGLISQIAKHRLLGTKF